MRLVTALSVALLGTSGCSKEYEPEPKAKGDKEKTEDKKSNVVKIQTAVPYGKYVACEDLIDLEAFAQATGLDLGEMRDRGSSDSSATAVCAFMRAGEPPSDNAQLSKFKKNAKLGVLPGDEYCMVRAYCDKFTDPDDFEEQCKKDGDSMNESLPVPACVHQSQRASEWAYTYKVIDPDTKCILEVLGGPSVTDENLVQLCTNASVDSVTKDGLKNVLDKPSKGVVELEPGGEEAASGE